MASVTPESSGERRHAVRKQVSRACNWCRSRRVKCDLNRPCNACQKSGVSCADERTEHPRSLPQALREIERLRERIRQLEAEAAESDEPTPNTALTTPPHTLSQAALKDGLHPWHRPRIVGGWEGISVATARSEQTSYFGPPSMQYFLSRVGTFIGNAFADPVPTRNMLLTGANRRLPYLSSNELATESSLPPPNGLSKVIQPTMTRAQEEYFLGTFWEAYYYTLPIIDEEVLHVHYASLWDDAYLQQRGQRKDSALVDMLLALCIQYSSSFLPLASTATAAAKEDDPTTAGRWYYRRGKALLASVTESPSVTTVQVQLLAAVYLYCASFQNTSHSTLAIAVRNATIAGLHREPPSHLCLAERELRKRLWWTLWTLDRKMCLKLGRPFDVGAVADMSVSLPSDSLEVACTSALHDPALVDAGPGHFTWLTYGTHLRAVVSTASDIQHTISPLYDNILSSHDPPLTSPYRHPAVLEQCAQILSSHVKPLHELATQVPAILLLPRGSGADNEPFSFDCSAMCLDDSVPMWLQGQRLYLELTYHSMAISLYRPFISFYQRGVGSTGLHRYMPATERHAARCVRHAITFVRIAHRAVRETTLLAPGWNEYFHWLWNAAVTLTGFLLAHPLHALGSAAREAADCAASVCDTYAAAGFVVAADAATILRSLLVKVDDLLAQVGGAPDSASTTTAGQLRAPAGAETVARGVVSDATTAVSIQEPSMGGSLSWLDPLHPDNPDNFSMFMDWALAVDSFNSFDQLLGPVEWDGLKW